MTKSECRMTRLRFPPSQMLRRDKGLGATGEGMTRAPNYTNAQLTGERAPAV